MDTGILFGCIGIQIAADHFQPIEYLGGIPLVRPFKQQVLYKVGQAILPFLFIPRPGIHQYTGVRHGRRYLMQYKPDTIG